MRKKDEVDINKISRSNVLFSLSLKLNYVRVILELSWYESINLVNLRTTRVIKKLEDKT